MSIEPAPVPTVEIRPEAFTADALAERGLSSLTQAAIACGLPKTTMTRVVAGTTKPGERFIAAVLAGFTSKALVRGDAPPKFEDLFTIVKP